MRHLPLALTGALVLAAAVAVAITASAHGGPPVELQDMQVTIRVLPDGSLDITERVEVSAEQGGRAYWPLGGRRADAVSGVVVVTTNPVEVRASVEVEGAKVGWLVPAGVSAVTLRYQVAAVVRAVDGRSQLRWDALPFDRDEIIGIAKVIVQLPQAYDPATLATDLDTAPVNDNTQHRVLNSRTLYYEGRTLAPGTTLTIIGRWPGDGMAPAGLNARQLRLIQPLAIALASLLALWALVGRRRSMKHEV